MWIAQQLRLRGIWDVEHTLSWSELLDWADHYNSTGGQPYGARIDHARMVYGLMTQNWDRKKAPLPKMEDFIYPKEPEPAAEEKPALRRDIGLVKSLKAQADKMKKHAQRAREKEARSNG